MRSQLGTHFIPHIVIQIYERLTPLDKLISKWDKLLFVLSHCFVGAVFCVLSFESEYKINCTHKHEAYEFELFEFMTSYSRLVFVTIFISPSIGLATNNVGGVCKPKIEQLAFIVIRNLNLDEKQSYRKTTRQANDRDDGNEDTSN